MSTDKDSLKMEQAEEMAIARLHSELKNKHYRLYYELKKHSFQVIVYDVHPKVEAEIKTKMEKLSDTLSAFFEVMLGMRPTIDISVLPTPVFHPCLLGMSVAFSELKTEEYVPGRPVVYYFEPPLREASRAKAEDLKWVMEISLSTLENPPEVYEALDATDAYRKMQESLGLSQNQEKVTVTNSEVVSVTPEDEPTILKSISVPEFVDPPVKKHKKNPDRDGHSLGRKRKTKAIVALRSKRKQVAKTVEAFAEVGELAQTMISKIESGQYVRPMYWQKWCLKAGVAEDTYIQIMHDNHLPVRMSNNKATQNSWVETPLIALRKSIGLSRQKVSKDMGISERHLRNAELGRECPESVREIVRKWYKIKPEDYKEMGIQTQIEAIDVGAEKRVLA